MVKATMQNGLLDTIGPRLVDGVYAPGDVVRAEDWEHEFDVSRTVIRETLKVLESMGLVAARRRVGITVQDRSSWNVFDPQIIRWRFAGPHRGEQLRSLTELRLSIEPVAAHKAALLAGRAERDELLSHAVLLEQSGIVGDLEGVLEHDIAFHSLLLRASGNEMFAAFAGVVAEVLAVTGHIVHDEAPEHHASPQRHLHTLAARAISRGDGAAAETAVRDLLLEVDEQTAAAERRKH